MNVKVLVYVGVRYLVSGGVALASLGYYPFICNVSVIVPDRTNCA